MNNARRLYLKWLIPIGTISLLLYIGISTIVLYLFFIKQSESYLHKTSERIQDDLVLKDGKWDLTRYNSDSSLMDNNPLYIITSEGVIIERSRPINGLLDLSRFTLINQYLVPTTIENVTNEKWRGLAEPITTGDQAIGIVFATYYQPEDNKLEEIDQNLKKTVNIIKQDLSVEGDDVDVSRVDSRKIPYDINFQIVTRFNKVLFQSNNNNSVSRMPTNIDRSYVDNQLKGGKYKQVKDRFNHATFLTSTVAIYNDKNLLSGIIVTGVEIDSIYQSLLIQAIVSSILGILTLLLAIPVGHRLLKKIHLTFQQNNEQRKAPTKVVFLKKEGKLLIDQNSIDIPYASFQYYFCHALMQKPQKKWEADELLELFGEDMGGEKWRKVYDTMIGLNRKTDPFIERLFIIKNKRYFINPLYTKLTEYINS